MSKIKGLYFRLGGVTPYTTDTYLYNSTKGWYFIENNVSYYLNNVIKLTNWNKNIIDDLLINYEWEKIGLVVTNKHSWGLLLNADIFNNLYNDDYLLSNEIFWTNIMKNNLIAQIFTQYENFINENEMTNNTSTVTHIKTTEDDPEINKSLIPDLLFTKLSNNQKHEIGWMYNWENTCKFDLPSNNCVPLLDTGFYYVPDTKTDKLIKKSDIQNNKIFAHCGILASETGSGKTISIIGLLSTDIINKNKIANLIIVTKNILYQWMEEFKKFCPEMKVLFVENSSMWESFDFSQMSKYNVVLTHREVVFSQNKKYKTNYNKITDFGKIYWSRIIFDEFHEIIANKNYIDVFAKLKSSFKWGLTGTLNDSDLISMKLIFKILSFDYFDKTKIKQKEKFMLTNTLTNKESEIFKLFYINAVRKNYRAKLPKLTIKKYFVKMQQLNTLIYKSENQLNVNELCSHLTDIWKQTENTKCDDIDALINLITNKRKSEIEKLKIQSRNTIDPASFKRIKEKITTYQLANDYFQEIIIILQSKKFECPICMECHEDTQNIVITDCMHVYCKQCFDIFNNKGTNFCVTCKSIITSQNVVIHPKLRENTPSKIDKIIESIKNINQEKIILFTQFESLANHISVIFELNDISYVVLKGIPSEINISLNKFKNDKNIKVLIMSIEQSASGLNITEATHIFFAHPIFNYTHHDAIRQYMQCIGRSYRYGQKKNVSVHIFSTIGTIEESLSNVIDCLE